MPAGILDSAEVASTVWATALSVEAAADEEMAPDKLALSEATGTEVLSAEIGTTPDGRGTDDASLDTVAGIGKTYVPVLPVRVV